MSSVYEDALPSSPPIAASNRLRKPPPVTPRRFNRFFTPRDASSPITSSSSRALRSLTSSSVNTRAQSDDFPDYRESKRRRIIKHEEVERIDSGSALSLRSSPCPEPVTASLAPIVRSRYQYSVPVPRIPWASIVDSFTTRQEDRHVFETPPYCAAPCNTNELVAIGDEGGGITLLDPSADFRRPFLRIASTHTNAIMDLAFSPDDSKLASVAGDKCGNVIEMRTQQTIRTLADGHSQTPKRIIWQPGNQDILVTCGRDSMVQIWDLRARESVATLGDPNTTTPHVTLSPQKTIWPGMTKTTTLPRSNTPSRAFHRFTSTTSIDFLPQYSHHLLTASANGPHLCIWDIRSRFTNEQPQAVSITTPPGETARYGIAHTTISPEGSNLYVIGKNNAVTTYSTSHLVLGQALSERGRPVQGRSGAGPISTWKHPDMVIGSFYVRGAVRKARDDKTEVLAVGSSKGCAVLFPLSDRVPQSRRYPGYDYVNGTALKGAHTSEVSSVCWTYDGELVTVGDDGIVNLWRENADCID